MKRELKAHSVVHDIIAFIYIARPIPMKRELKVLTVLLLPCLVFADCKAHPDEKGTERMLVLWVSLSVLT